jgi:hypothetical protein
LIIQAGDCDTDHYLVAANYGKQQIMERIATGNQRSYRFHMERFNLKKLYETEGKVPYRIEVSNRFAVFEGFGR